MDLVHEEPPPGTSQPPGGTAGAERLVPAGAELGGCGGGGGQAAHSTTVEAGLGACSCRALSYWVKCEVGPLSPRFCLKRCYADSANVCFCHLKVARIPGIQKLDSPDVILLAGLGFPPWTRRPLRPRPMPSSQARHTRPRSVPRLSFAAGCRQAPLCTAGPLSHSSSWED